MAKKPTSVNDVFKPCPNRPNCVSSLSVAKSRFVDPLRYKGSSKTARKALMKILREMPGNTVKQVKGNYIHVECRSRILRFTDDLELFFDEAESQIHVRSASRVGYWDMGVNRRRVAAVRKTLEKELSGPKTKKK